jgi:hypothetical protein
MKEQTAIEWLETILHNFIHPEHGAEFAPFVDQAKEIKKQQLEKELNRFFLYFRDNGERLLGASIEQLVKSYLKSR